MQKKSKKYFIISGILFLLFALFTVIVTTVDVKPIGPQQTTVGLASVNQFLFSFFGANRLWYDITDWLGFAAIAVALGFAVLGLVQLVKRKSIQKVDRRILLLGAFYFLMLLFYALFEFCIINYRPILLSQTQEASYPSSHAMIVICIMSTAMLQFPHYLRDRKVPLVTAELLAALVIAVTVVGRLISGVHWFTDIVAGILLSSALVTLYCAALQFSEEKNSEQT